MKITLAKHSGFCMGVKNAVLRIINELSDKSGEIYVYGPLIHNPQTVEILRLRGLHTIGTLEGIKGRQVAIRSHGIPLDQYRRIQSESDRVINLTCPRVAKVQSIIKKYAGRGYHTIIVGDKDHAEVDGLKSYATAGHTIVSEKDDIGRVPERDSYILVAQTTAERSFFIEVIEEVRKLPGLVEIIDTICDSTRLRQEDVISGIRNGVDTLVVVGGKNSANTKRLAHIGEKSGVRTLFVETDEEISEKDFRDTESVLVTAGASTPGWIINNVMERLYEIHYRKTSAILYGLLRFLGVIVKTSILSSVAAFFITAMVFIVSDMPVDYTYAAVSLFYVFTMYTINNYLEKDSLRINNPYKYRIYNKYGRTLLILSVAASLGIIPLSLGHGPVSGVILLASFVIGGVYSSGWVKNMISAADMKMIRNIYNSRILTCFGWLMITVAVPVIDVKTGFLPAASLGVLAFSIILMRLILIDTIAFQGDLILGRETLAVLLGRGAQTALFTALGACTASLIIATALLYNPYFSLFLINTAFYTALFFSLSKKDFVASLKYELVVEANMLLLSLFASVLIYTRTS